MHKPWLAASPDDLVEYPSEPPDRQHGLVEIKCPYSARMYKPEAACTELNRFCCSLVNGTPTMKRTHNYYYQVLFILQEGHGATCLYGHLLAHSWNG